MNHRTKLLDRSKPGSHLAQFYAADDAALAVNVARYLGVGIGRNDALAVISGSANASAFRRQLSEQGSDVEDAIRTGRLVFLDAAETLKTFLVDGQPDWRLFETAINDVVARVCPQAESGRIRIYGEMVGLLWARREFNSAIKVEQFWNRLLLGSPMQLFCGYPIDIFGPDLQGGALDAILCTHTDLVPATHSPLETFIQRAMELHLGTEAVRLKRLMRLDARPAWAEMPAGERAAIWLRNNLPREAKQILQTARRLHQKG
jgi:hypothetical protein